LLEEGFTSFNGRGGIPMRHGLTIGEVALLVNEMLGIGAELQVVAMQGWRRKMLWPETGRPWVMPSPNMPRFETAVLYPGQVLVEGTRLSEGRGTTTPFEVVGAPYIDPHELAAELANYPTPGLTIRPVRFRPTFNKWAGQSCGGVALHHADPTAVRSYTTTVAIFACLRALYPERFTWLSPPYEYEETLMPIDILSGSSRLRETLDAGQTSPADVERLSMLDVDRWRDLSDRHLLYS
ncbi:MAG: exo-beta-N-acetylmuramidase NamZ family protein, partial [Thermoguttaceae bacterium]